VSFATAGHQDNYGRRKGSLATKTLLILEFSTILTFTGKNHAGLDFEVYADESELLASSQATQEADDRCEGQAWEIMSSAAKKAWATRRRHAVPQKQFYKSTGLGGHTEVGSLASPTKRFIRETLKRSAKRKVVTPMDTASAQLLAEFGYTSPKKKTLKRRS